MKAKATKDQATTGLVPELRFPEFRGEAGWAPEPMGEVYSFKGNNSLSRDKLNYAAGSVKNIHYGDIHTKFSTHFDITKELVPFINEADEGVIRDENLCTEGDMIFADASEDLADIGKAIEIAHLNGERVVSGLHTILARRVGARIGLGFGGHLFKSEWVRKQIQKEAQGSKVLGISPTRLRNVQLPLPHDLAEQQKIAACLGSLDELIAAQGRKVKALKIHKKGLMQQLFPREGESQPRLRFPGFEGDEDWVTEPLAQLANYENGKAYEKDIVETGRYVVVNSRFISTDGAIRKYTNADYLVAKTGEVLMVLSDLPKGKALAKCYFVEADDRYAVNQRVCRLRPTKIDGKFLYYALNRHPRLLAYDDGLNQTHLSKGGVTECPLCVPVNKAEQQRIAAGLSSLDALITAEAQTLDTLKSHKQGLMQQLFPTAEALEA